MICLNNSGLQQRHPASGCWKSGCCMASWYVDINHADDYCENTGL